MNHKKKKKKTNCVNRIMSSVYRYVSVPVTHTPDSNWRLSLNWCNWIAVRMWILAAERQIESDWLWYFSLIKPEPVRTCLKTRCALYFTTARGRKQSFCLSLKREMKGNPLAFFLVLDGSRRAFSMVAPFVRCPCTKFRLNSPHSEALCWSETNCRGRMNV